MNNKVVSKQTAELETRDFSFMQRIAERDGEAFRELFDSRGPAVLAVLLRIVRDRAIAEELLQEVFLQVWNLAGSYRADKAPPFAWILMLARSRAIDWLRQQRSLERREQAGQWQASPVEPPSVEQIDQVTLHRRIRTAVQKLPEAQRVCVELAYFGELSHSQIADRLAAPLGTVKSRIQLGLRRLQASLRAVHLNPSVTAGSSART